MSNIITHSTDMSTVIYTITCPLLNSNIGNLESLALFLDDSTSPLWWLFHEQCMTSKLHSLK